MKRSELVALADELDALRRSRPRNMADYPALLERAIAAFDDDAATACEVFELPELYDELWQAYETMGRTDDALAAADAAVAAGLRAAPDPRCLRAEILMRAGRIAEAEPIWAAVRADTPDDIWLYNNAGLEYAAAGDHQTALEWLTEGLRLAIETGDRYRLVDQLAEQREESMFALRLPADELQAKALAFADEQMRAAEARRTALDAARRAAREPKPEIARGGHDPVREVAWVWLPPDEYEQGLQAWPDLREDELITRPEGRISHAEYCRELQQRLRDAAEAGMTRIKIAPVRPAAFAAWCGERGEEPGPESRASYAAELARLRDPGLISWPPGRNEPCWCGSGRKYKKCCAAPR